MAQNPYAGFNASADPYTNGDGLAASPNPPQSRSPGGTSSTDDYDPYGDRYGTAPIATSNSSSNSLSNPNRERRAGPRAGGDGGFYANNNGSAPSINSSPKPSYPYDGRENRSRENLPTPRMQRIPSDESRRLRYGVSDGNMRAPEMPAMREFRKPSTGDRSYSGGSGGPNNSSLRDKERTVARPSGGSGGSGTRQIEG